MIADGIEAQQGVCMVAVVVPILAPILLIVPGTLHGSF
jgi:hypothetical protein